MSETESFAEDNQPDGEDNSVVSDIGRVGSDKVVEVKSVDPHDAEVGAIIPMIFLGGRIIIDSSGHELRVDGSVQHTTAREFDLLHVLASNNGHVLDRDNIMQACWDTQFYTNILAVNISSLRKKLGDTSWVLRTVRGVGYVFDDRLNDEGD